VRASAPAGMQYGSAQVSAAVDRLPRVFGATKLPRILLLAAVCLLTIVASAGAATVVHFQPESASALKVQLHHHEVHALTIHPTPAPGHVHVSLNNGQHFTVVYSASEQTQLVALARADGTPVAVSVSKSKAAAKPVHHTLRYVAGGILVLVIVVVAAVLLVDRRRKLGEEGNDAQPPAQSQPSQ
jgi:hypothetical protein